MRSRHYISILGGAILILQLVGSSFAQRQKEIIISNVDFVSDDTLTLHGSMILPSDWNMSPTKKRLFPLVIYIHGSGPQTRDEVTPVFRYDTAFRNAHHDWSNLNVEGVSLEVGRARVLEYLLGKDTLAPDDGAKYVTYKDSVAVFKDIAVELAQQSVASFVYDKRSYTYGKLRMLHGLPPARAALGGLDDYVRDAEAALRVARRWPEIDTNRIYILGYSEGASGIAQLVAERHPLEVRGLILLAPSVLPIDSIMHLQLSTSRAWPILAPLFHSMRANAPGSDSLYALNASGSYWKSWMRITDSVVRYMMRVRCPILLLHGTLDLNQNVESSYQLDSLLSARSRFPSTTLRVFPGLDHTFRLPWDIRIDNRVPAEILRWLDLTSNR